MFSKMKRFLSPSFSSSLIFSRSRYNFSERPRSLKEKMRTQNYSYQTQKKSRQYSHLQIGLYGLVFALCFAAIPLYRTFCEHVGLVGNNDKKTYEFKEKQINNLKKYVVKFQGFPQPDINWEFQPIQKSVMVGTSQSAIVFYRLRNKQNRPIVGFSTYNIAPQQANLYFSKIQCFCFNQQMINPQQELLLPLFFYLQPQLIEDPDVGRVRQITVNYQFYESNNQDLAKFAADEIKRVEDNKRKLAEMRARKHNMDVDQYEEYLDQKAIKQEDSLPIIDVEGVKAEADRITKAKK